MFKIDEYSIKKHFLAVFVCLLLGGVAFLYLRGERIFIAIIDAQTPKGSLALYHNVPFEFSVSYPSRYLVGEELGDGGDLTVYFTHKQDPPFYLGSSPKIYAREGDWREYLAEVRARQEDAGASIRTVTVGDAIFAKELTFGARNGKERIKEVIFGRSGNTYVILQRYDSAIDPAYPLLVKTFQFE